MARRQEARNWRTKLHPVFFDLAAFNQEIERQWRQIETDAYARLHTAALIALEMNAGADRLPEHWRATLARQYRAKAGQLLARCGSQVAEIQSRYPDPPHNLTAYSYLDGARGESDLAKFARLLHFWRYRRSLSATMAQAAKGDFAAFCDVAQTQEDVWRAAQAQGPLKPFRGDQVHRQLLELVFCWQTASLSADDLADLFDEYCGCGKEHDPDALKHLFARLRRELKRAFKAVDSGTIGRSDLI